MPFASHLLMLFLFLLRSLYLFTDEHYTDKINEVENKISIINVNEKVLIDHGYLERERGRLARIFLSRIILAELPPSQPFETSTEANH